MYRTYDTNKQISELTKGEYMDKSKPLAHLKADPNMAICKNPPSGDDIRNIFQRDRDRIMYSKAFRRLAGKTQMFVTGHDDHLRTRLTHTLEVSQIARTISSQLGLDLDLTEAIALGHDIGHAPFGHVGERVLNYFSNGCEIYKGFNYRYETDSKLQGKVEILPIDFRGFKHNWQSVRIAVSLARHRGKSGLDLSLYTVYGMLNHTATEYSKCRNNSAGFCKLRERSKERNCIDKKLYQNFYQTWYGYYDSISNYTIESSVVAISDEIAQRHHDIEDGIRAQLISKKEIIKELRTSVKLKIQNLPDHSTPNPNDKEDLITFLSGEVVNFYVRKTVNYFISVFSTMQAGNLEELIRSKNNQHTINTVDIESAVEGDDKLHGFLKERMLSSNLAQVMDGRADFLIRRLFKAFISNPQQLPDNTIRTMMRSYRDYRQSKDYKIRSYSKVEYEDVPIGELRKHLSSLQTIGKYSFRAIMLRTICDYISGMTDRKAISEYQNLYGIHDRA